MSSLAIMKMQKQYPQFVQLLFIISLFTDEKNRLKQCFKSTKAPLRDTPPPKKINNKKKINKKNSPKSPKINKIQILPW